VLPLEDFNGRMTKRVKWWQTLNDLGLDDAKENYQIIMWYKDQAWIDKRNMNVEIVDQVKKESFATSLDIIWRYSNWRFDWRFNLKNNVNVIIYLSTNHKKDKYSTYQIL